jgi:hypothetical protein
MPGPPPKEIRRRRNRPERGDWVTVTATGWQHGDVPAPPAGLLNASQKAWATWMGAWFAAHWTPGDLPGLWVVIGLYDRIERGEFHRSAEWRMWADTYGITPKGQQDRRWAPPETETLAAVRPLGSRRQ